MKWAEGRTTEHGKEKHGMALSWRQPGGINRFCIGITASLNCDVTVTIAVSHSHTLAFRCRWRASCNDMTPHVSLLAHAAGWWVVLTHRTKRGLESRCYANKEQETNVHTHTHSCRERKALLRNCIFIPALMNRHINVDVVFESHAWNMLMCVWRCVTSMSNWVEKNESWHRKAWIRRGFDLILALGLFLFYRIHTYVIHTHIHTHT